MDMHTETHSKEDVYRAAQAKETRDGLILDNLGVVRSILGKTIAELPNYADAENLEAAGVLGLVEAALQFDESRGVPFLSFAYPRIKGAIVDELRRNSPLPQRMLKLVSQVRRACEQLSPVATPEAIAEQTGLSMDDVEAALDAMRMRHMYTWDEHQGWLASLHDLQACEPDAEAERKEVAELLSAAIARLPENERLVITLYYLEDLLLKEIGEVLSLSESRVSRLRSKAEFRLSQMMSRANIR